jgi:glycosyltransferase involved in cell wall biosynthesis
LRLALDSAMRQSVGPEVVLLDDGSTDGTADFVRTCFPSVRLHRFEESKGLIVRRNEAARLASGEVIFSIDDDAAFSSPFTVAQTLAEFNSPRIGAVAVPYADVNRDPAVRQRAPGDDETYVTDSFIGTAHALRRQVFLSLGGYRGHLIHQGEESDFCLRMLSRGWVVRLGAADPIHHFESVRRDFRRMDFFGRRNDVLFAWHNVPLAYFPVHLIATTVNGIIAGLKSGRFRRMLNGTFQGYLWCLRHPRHRTPVNSGTYLLSRKLKKSGPHALAAIENLLPPLPQFPSSI